MPIYEFRCSKCEQCFEKLVFASDGGSAPTCPSCGGGDTHRLMSSFSCGTGNSGSGLGNASAGCSPSGGFS
ncbi:MAG: zinc ribbon domain-containing protein [Pseudomonadota bacterium]